jgi:hypothetical protein
MQKISIVIKNMPNVISFKIIMFVGSMENNHKLKDGVAGMLEVM